MHSYTEFQNHIETEVHHRFMSVAEYVGPQCGASSLDAYDLLAESESCFIYAAPHVLQPHIIKIPKKVFVSNRFGEDLVRLTDGAPYPEVVGHMLIDERHEATPAPLHIPYLIDFDTEGTRAIVAEYIPGVTLQENIHQDMTVEEQATVGKAIGSFAAWMKINVPMSEFEVLEHSPPYDRVKVARRMTQPMLKAHLTQLPKAIAETAVSLVSEFYIRQRCGLFTPTMIGHDDLKSLNIIFDEDRVTPRAVIDLGGVQPITPERELRHVPFLGPIATHAAITAFEDQTGGHISKELVMFWAKFQAMSNAIGNLMLGTHIVQPQTYHRLEILWPDLPWDQLPHRSFDT